MRFLSKVFIAVAAASALLSSSAVDAFSTESFRSHASTLHSHIQSNRDLLASKINAIHYHTQAASDCEAALLTPTVDNVKACLSINGAASFDAHCAANLKDPFCKIDLSSALLIWTNGGNPFPTGFPTNFPTGFPTGIPGGGNGDAAAKCTNALAEFGKNVQAKCASLVKDMIPSTTTPVNTDLSALLNQQCALMSGTGFNECKAAIASVADVQAACPDYPISTIKGGVKEIYEVLDGSLSALCVKDDTDSSKYCLASVISASTGMTNIDPAAFTDSVLNGMCKPCINTVISKIAGLAGDVGQFSAVQTSLNYFQALCTKDPTNPSQYCMNVFNALVTTPEGKVPALSTVCTPCLNALVQKMSFIPEDVRQKIKNVQGTICQKDNNGGYCLDVIQAQGQAAFTALGVCGASATTCSADCKTAVQTVFSTQSCCFAKLGVVGLQQILSQSDDALAKQFGLPILSTVAKCGVEPVVNNCEAPTASIPVSLSLPNIDAKKIAADATVRAKLSASLALDLSAALSIDASAIVIGQIEADPSTKSGVKVSFTIKVDASLKSGYANTFNQKLQKGELPLENTAKTAEASQAKVDETEPLTASGQGAASSSAVHINGSVAIVSLMMIIAAFAKF